MWSDQMITLDAIDIVVAQRRCHQFHDDDAHVDDEKRKSEVDLEGL